MEPGEFISVTPEMVRRLGSANAALVWSRIQFVCQIPGEGRVEDESGRWWRVSVNTLSEETGLSVKMVRTALTGLENGAHIELEKHRILGGGDQTVSYRATLSPAISPEGQIELPSPANGRSSICPQGQIHLPSGANLSFIEEVKDINPDAHVRADVLEVCELLAKLMISNGCRKPTISAKWNNDIRLLLDKDCVPLATVLAVTEWSQQSDFWKANIQSPAKLRAKFDTLRLQMQRDGVQLPATPSGIEDWLRDCWTKYDTQSVETRSGLRFDPPDIPADVTDVREFNLMARRQWITEYRQVITTRILAKEAPPA
ncbi:helix-turn-helix domain-containing protein [Rhodococcus qingshengii]|uniref:hypothetical protein n=1 Tax=Rhodococcus TaxID=1827 RepID=UPI000F61EEAA|nr:MULTISPECIES: hypothetical protein [Rhodococcus]AZI62769.1 hypothetical protein EHW12_17550 [Rhodococcus sp. NJ-530]BDQ21110.1 helix-turn-helix domain-containing protein [Rhodococcus qingshengii]